MLGITDPGPERWLLGFRDAVLSAFSFLRSYGLRPVQEESTFVRYESSEVFVNVYHGRGSFELGVEIGRLSRGNDKVSLQEIVTWAGAEKREGFGHHVMFQVSSRDGVQAFVPKLANLVRMYADPFLRADAGVYDAVEKARADATAEYMKQMNLKDLRKQAEAAWRSKDYERVVELYGGMRGDLTEVEAGKLAYAERQILSIEQTALGPAEQKRRR